MNDEVKAAGWAKARPMARKYEKAAAASAALDRAKWTARGWEFSSEVRIEGKLPLAVGRRFKVSRAGAGHWLPAGWYTFREAVRNPSGDRWIEATHAKGFYSIPFDRVRQVEREYSPTPSG